MADLVQARAESGHLWKEPVLDLGVFGSIHLNVQFLSALLSIVIIDLVLAGDNAVVIAMAVKTLPDRQRLHGIILGAGAAVLLRVVLTFFVAQMLLVSYVKLVGGVLIGWIAVKLLIEGLPEEAGPKDAKSLGQAVWIIMVADITMALDNMLAVAGASHGNFFLLLFGLGLSIPLVVFTSNLLSALMDRYPVILYIGAAILGKVSGGMMITDPFIVKLLDPSKPVVYLTEAAFAAGVVVVGRFWLRRRRDRQ